MMKTGSKSDKIRALLRTPEGWVMKNVDIANQFGLHKTTVGNLRCEITGSLVRLPMKLRRVGSLLTRQDRLDYADEGYGT